VADISGRALSLPLFLKSVLMSIFDFLCAEDGVATIDWVVILAALTGLGLWMVDYLGADVLRDHSYAMRGELQDPHFDTDWFDHVEVLPPSLE